MITTEVTHGDGATLLVKRADPTVATETARLGREATMLAVARHPGVVELVAGPDDAQLCTVFVGARTLADPAPIEVRLDALAAAAATIADLHGLGIVHGRVEAGHIVLTAAGRPVLCGFAESGLAGDRRTDGRELRPSGDVAALGTLLDRILRDDGSLVGSSRRREVDRAALGRLVVRATADDPTVRPSARSFAAALDAARPHRTGRSPAEAAKTASAPIDPPAAADLVAPPTLADPEPAPRPRPTGLTRGRAPGARLDGPRLGRPRSRTIVTLAAALVACAAITLGLDTLHDPAERAPTGTRNQTHQADQADQTDHAEAGPAPAPGDPADPDASQPAGIVTIDGHRYALGTSDDQVLVAVWSCGGPAVPVLVRPDGSVFRFEALATADHTVRGVASGQLPPGVPARLARDADGCIGLQAGTGTDVTTIAVPSAATPSTSS